MAASPMPPLPRLQAGDPASVVSWANQLVASLERQIQRMNAAAGGKWAVTDLTVNRTLDAGAATLAETSQALGTLITDLQAAGVIAPT